MIKRIFALCCVGMLAVATAARADQIDTFTSSNGECCFTVQLDQISTTEIGVTVSLVDGATYWTQSGGPHRGFTFNLDTSAITISNISAPWSSTYLNTSSTSDAYGTFSDWFSNGWESGSSGHIGSSLTFDITDASGISFTDFLANSDGYYFSADILGSDGGTGEAGANTKGIVTGSLGTPPVPEPSSLVLLGTGILGFAGMARRRMVSAGDRA